MPLAGAECSTVEPPPFYGSNEAELIHCASDAIDFAEGAFDMSTRTLTVDRLTVPDLAVGLVAEVIAAVMDLGSWGTPVARPTV